MNRISKILIFLLAVMSGLSATAQQGEARASIDSSNILIGDHVHLKLTYTFPAKATVAWPVFKDTLVNKIEVIEKGKMDTAFSADYLNKTLSQTLTITCFDSGSYTIPPISFSHKMPGDTTRYISSTQPLMLMVNTVAVDTTKEIKDIKAPLTAPWTLLELLPWIACAVVLAALITLALIYFIRRRKKKPLFSRLQKPSVPAHIRALEALEKLRVSHLWQQGKIKEFHSRLTDIVRLYIEERFGIPALEMVTSDVLESLMHIEEISDENQQHLRRMLQLADMVKFAKFLPLPDEHDSSLRYAVQFVNETANKEEPPQEETRDAGENETDVEPSDKTGEK